MENLNNENLIQDSVNPKTVGIKQRLEVSSSGENERGSLHQTLGAIQHSINYDQPVTESHLADLHSAVENVTINISGKEFTLKQAEAFAATNTFLKETNVFWGAKEENLPTFRFSFSAPKDLKYKERFDHPDKSRFGEYTLNPELIGIDFEKAKIFIPNLQEKIGKYCFEVFEYVIDTYGDKYFIPGVEYWKWMIENPEKAEEVFKRQNYNIKTGYFYFPGSVLCDAGGYWLVPDAQWRSSAGGLIRSAGWLESAWVVGEQIILIEK